MTGRELEVGAFAFGSPVLHGHAVGHIEGLEAPGRASAAARMGGSMASRNGSATVVPSPLRIVLRGNFLERKFNSGLLLAACLLRVPLCSALSGRPGRFYFGAGAAFRMRNAGLLTIPRMSDDQR